MIFFQRLAVPIKNFIRTNDPRERFNHYDKDMNGNITFNEFANDNLFNGLHYNSKKDAFKGMDKNNDLVISPSEFDSDLK